MFCSLRASISAYKYIEMLTSLIIAHLVTTTNSDENTFAIVSSHENNSYRYSKYTAKMV